MRYTVIWVLLGIGIIAASVSHWKEQNTPIPNDEPFETVTVPVGKLPDNVIPLHYQVDLTLLPDEDVFVGEVFIDIEILEEAPRIWMHSRDLVVEESDLILESGELVPGVFMDVDESGVGKLILKQPVAPGKARIRLKFHGPFRQNRPGVYVVEEAGRNYIFSQLEPLGARMVFPSFDEPRFKTPFDLTIVTNEGLKVVTATNEKAIEPIEGGYARHIFKTTKPIPTYLLSFIVGDLDIVEHDPLPANGVRNVAVPLRGVTVKGKGDQIRYALENTQAHVDALENYFGIAYPYSKLDIIADPGRGGAMENVGAITYSEPLILVNEASPADQLKSFNYVHAHELSHQWFGNLVTPAWWDDIWLNEAFAAWIGRKSAAIATGDPAYGRMAVSRSLGVMNQDSLASARRVRQPVENQHHVEAAFDGITYSKGAAVLGMFEAAIGEDVFRDGIRRHLKRFEFEAATSAEFFESIALAAEDPGITAAFSSFVDQIGVPLARVEWSCLEGGALEIDLSQKRSLPLGSKANANVSWNFPVCLAIADDGGVRQQCTNLKEQSVKLELEGSCPAYVMPNAGSKGYYRWSLSENGWRALIENFDSLSSAEKFSSLDSATAAFAAGEIDLWSFMDVLNMSAEMIDWEVADRAFSVWRMLTDKIAHPSVHDALEERKQSLYAPAISRLGLWPYSAQDQSDPAATALYRQSLAHGLAVYGDHLGIRADLKAMAEGYLGESNETPLNQRAMNPILEMAALAVALDEGSEAFFDRALARFAASTDMTLRRNFIYGLARVRDPARLGKVYDFLLSEDLRVHEMARLAGGLAYNPYSNQGLWQWLRINRDAVMTRLTPQRSRSIASWAAYLCTPEDRALVEEIVSPVITSMIGGDRYLAKSLESIDLCIARKQRWSDEVTTYFGGTVPEPDGETAVQ